MIVEGSGKLTVVSCLHGNEVFGKTVIDAIAEEHELAAQTRTILANEAAYEAGERMIDTDLNRSFAQPELVGNEAEIARQLLPKVYRSPYVFDIHTTIGDVDFVPIITKLTKNVRFILSHLNVRNVALIESKQAPTSLIGNHRGGVSLEFGEAHAAETTEPLDLVLNAARGVLSGRPGSHKLKRVFTISSLIPLEAPQIEPEVQNGDFSEVHEGYVLMPRAENYQGFLAKKVEVMEV